MNEQKPEVAAHQSHTGLYLGIFGALGVLTILTVAVSYLHLSRPKAIALALVIAATKVTLIATFFMHLKYEKKLIHLLMYTAVFLVLILLFFVLPDLGSPW